MQPTLSDRRRVAITAFEMVGTAAGLYSSPEQVSWQSALSAAAPTTVAGVLAAHRRLDLSSPPELDSHDYWFRAQLPDTTPEGARHLVFEGLATLCDVWLDGKHLLRTENMFRGYELSLDAPLRPGGELVLRFAALAPELAKRRPRPRFRTRLVDAQQLRFIRTSLLGRTPGFAPRIPAVGPYRPVSAEARPRASLREHVLRTRVEEVDEGRVSIELSFVLECDPGLEVGGATLVLAGEAANARFPLELSVMPDGLRCAQRVTLAGARLWWPHTHGEQPRCRLTVELGCAPQLTLDFGQIGFRSLTVDRGADGAGFTLHVNGQPLFCRGACWTVQDPIAFSDAGLLDTLELVRDGGMNMLRVGGTMQYESDAFYEACDQVGLLVFQDFMFANMDYPAGDAGFAAEVRAEVQGFLARTSGRPSLAVLCGGSEVEQQAAMLGLPPELWHSPLFYEQLPSLVQHERPDVPFVPNSPCGGALPFQLDAGIAHYYGVGAYLRPLHDARLSGVRFAAECLAFANVPEPASVDALLSDLEMPFHHPRWKERVPRDRGVGWDFEDVRDHYLELLYQVDARRLRGEDPERYLELSRAVVVDVMEATLAELRRAGAGCGGALVWWLKDLWLGAGWGVLDARGVPKSAYHALRRSFARLAMFATDEGMNGPELHVAHDGTEAFVGTLSVTLYRSGRTPIAEAETGLAVAARSVHRVRVDALFPRFVDAGYVYRFGPPSHDLLVAQLRNDHGDVVARTFVCPLAPIQTLPALGLSATCEVRAGHPGVLVQTQAFARRVVLELEGGYLPVDNYFHLEPDGQRWIALRGADGTPPPSGAALRGRVKALNAASFVRFFAQEGRL